MNKNTGMYIAEDYTLTYQTCSSNGKDYIMIYGIRDMTEDFAKHGKLKIPSKINNITVEKFFPEAFSCNNYIKEVIIENGPTEIAENLFFGCKNLELVTIPKSIKRIDSYSFSHCKSLKTVNFSEGLEEIGPYAFELTAIENLTLPNSLKTIKNNAFDDSYVCSVSLGPNVEYIGTSAFSNCIFLVDINFSENLSIIDDFAFKECSNLESAILPDNLTQLGYGVFDYCGSLKTIQIGKNLSYIDTTRDFAYACRNLENIIVHPEHPFLKVIKGTLYDYKKNTLIRVPPRIQNKNIIIPKWITSISPCCFNNVHIDNLFIKSKDIGPVSSCDIPFVNKIFCPPNSSVEKQFTMYGGFNIKPLKSKIDDFLDDIVDDSQNIDK